MNHDTHECETVPTIKFARDNDDNTNINTETHLS